MKRLALKYRPKIFAEVRGQDHPKRVISQLVLNNRSCANLLLYGSIGSGKTSLIRIYAKAINCQNVTAAGDRCFKCGPCTSVDKEGDEKRLERDSSIFSGLKELDTPTFRDSKDLKDELDGLLMEPIPAGRRRVIFFDEAHVLSKIKNVFDYLLKKVEEPPPNVAFCFATTALEQMSDALRSRTLELEVRPLTHDLSVELLTKASANEGIKFHDEALSLLAGLGEHQPRNMLQALDKMCLISNGAEITRDRVATVFGVDYIDNLVQYFEAVGAGEFEAQITKFLQWPDATRRKVRLIQLFLIGLYYVDLCGLIVSIDPVISSIRKEERKRVVDAFKHRLPGIDLKAFFEDLLSVWPVVTDDLSDEALLATVMRFQTVANRGVVAPRMQAMTERIVPEAVAEIGPASGPKRRTGTKDEDANAPKDPAYLGRSHIRSIFAASSFLVQTGHQPFNARITIRHRLFGHEGQPEASEHFKRFSQALKGRLKHWGGSGLRVFVQERTEEEGSCGRVIAQVPDPNVAASWFKKWHRSSRVAGEMEAIEFEVVP